MQRVGEVADLDELVKVVARDISEADERLPELAPAVCGHRLVQKLVGILLSHAVQLLQEVLRLALCARPASLFRLQGRAAAATQGLRLRNSA